MRRIIDFRKFLNISLFKSLLKREEGCVAGLAQKVKHDNALTLEQGEKEEKIKEDWGTYWQPYLPVVLRDEINSMASLMGAGALTAATLEDEAGLCQR